MEIIVGLMGGVGLFLYGMNVMSDGLQKAAGNKLKSIISMLTSNRLLAVGVGALVTAIIQSSTATTVMVVGFVNAGMMQLSQAVGVIMGANIGTTITAQIITFKVERFAPVVLGISVAIWLFTDKRKIKQYAEAAIGFAILFIGMTYLGEALRPLGEIPAFSNFLASFADNQFLGILAGFGITVIAQSSSATTGILLALSMEGLLSMESALPILFGINIGTTVTAIISSLSANKTAKRAAAIHFIFNFVGTIIFVLFLQRPTYRIITALDPGNVPRQIANAHTIFNLANTIILLPFANGLVWLSKKLIPGEDGSVQGIKYIDDRILETPSIALANAVKETLHMGNTAMESLENALGGFFEQNPKRLDETFELEKVVNELERQLAIYLVKLSNTNISGRDRELVDGLFNTINDIERVGDHAENIAELAVYAIDNQLSFSQTAIEELTEMKDYVVKSYRLALSAMRNLSSEEAMKVIELEGKVDLMEKSLRANHIQRLNNQSCSPGTGIVFLDLVSNMERITDHCANIAMAVLDEIKATNGQK